jgi:maltooligosyltrehalose trehalohydrolase
VDLLRIPSFRFLGYLQDHDQIGNRAIGDRISSGLSADLVKVGAGLVLTAPFTPMLFMGEEWAASTPWQYFTDHTDPALAKAVAEGRRAEFGAHGWGPAEVPNPQDEQTFLRSKLDWAERDTPRHQEILAWYRELIALRRAWPELTDPQLDRMQADYDEARRWLVLHRGRLRIAASLGEQPLLLPLGACGTAVLAASSSGVALDGEQLSMPPASFAVVATQDPAV